MSSTILPMPVTIEQVAAVLRNMSGDERRRLLELVPDLQEKPQRSSSRRLPKPQTDLAELRQEMLAALGGRLLTPDDPFLDDLTLGDYLSLPDAERARLWDRRATDAADEATSWEEVDVRADALPA
jgi:hypothetical protein